MFIKQRLVIFIIFIIEKLQNSHIFIKILGFLSKRFKSLLFMNINKKIFSFKNLSIAFIADGNRRYCRSKNNNLDLNPGISVIQDIIKFACFYEMSEVSFFLFSIRNFNRSENEIANVMNHAKSKNTFNLNIPIRVQIFGNIDLLEEDVKSNIIKIVEETSNNTGMKVNLFIGYSSSYEEFYIAGMEASRCIGMSEADINEFNDIETRLINGQSKVNNIGKKPYVGKVNLLIRTGGEKRLSDFMLRQVATGTAIDFVRPMWPEFSLINLSLCLIKYYLEERYLSK